jgi:dihydrolipoamide dehydrogenase
MDYRAVPRCVYTDPEMAAVGFTQAEAEAEGMSVRTHRVRLGRVGRALTLGETFGLAKLIYEEDTGKIVGFHVLGPHASELLSEISAAMRSGMTVGDLADVIHPHPTLSELVWECVDGAARELGS